MRLYDIPLRESIPRLFNGGWGVGGWGGGGWGWGGGGDHYDHPLCPGLQPGPPKSNPGGSGPEVLKRERGHVTSETGVSEVGVFSPPPPSLMPLFICPTSPEGIRLCDVKWWFISYSCLSGLILGMRPANERRRYKVTPSLFGWVKT